MTTAKESIILQKEKDWEPFLEIVKSTSNEYKLWKYINPSTTKAQLPSLTEPTKPTYLDIRGPIQIPALNIEEGIHIAALKRPPQYSDLTPDEKEEYRNLIDDWRHSIRKHEQQEQGLAKVHTSIIKIVAFEHMHYTYNIATVYDLMVNLKNRFAPTDKARES